MSSTDIDNQNDRPFNSFRTSKDIKVKALIADLINQYQNYEKAHGLRKRARKDKDLKTFHQQLEEAVELLAEQFRASLVAMREV